MSKKTKYKGFKIFLIIIGVLAIVSTAVALFFVPYVKSKIISYVEENTEYQLKINTIVFLSPYDLEINGVELRPKLDVKEFYKTNKIERDWISVKSNVSIQGVDWMLYFKE